MLTWLKVSENVRYFIKVSKKINSFQFARSRQMADGIFFIIIIIIIIIINFNLLPTMLSRYSDSLRAGRSGDLIPVRARFSAPVQTGPGARPASYTMSSGSLTGLKRQGRGVDHPPPSSVEVEWRVQLYICSPFRLSWPVIGWHLPLPTMAVK
jgi:hypothetical protein